jgi:hypothetical protein
MATNFPASLDSLTNPTSSDSLSSPSHSAQHANVNDAVEALQVKVGADSSAVTSSLDYKVAQLEALGTATAFTPTWSGFTLGDGTEEWYYVRVNDLIYVYGNTQLGSTSAVTGELQIDLPVEREALASTYEILGTATLFELGVAFWQGTAFSTNTTTVRLSPLLANLTYVKQGTTSSTVPFTWGTGDAIGASFTYKAD